MLADTAGGAWTFGGSILTFAFPMILFIVVAVALYVLYTKPEFIPGHPAPGLERPVSYTSVPGKPTIDPQAQATLPAGMNTAETNTAAANTADATGTTAGEAAETEGAE